MKKCLLMLITILALVGCKDKNKDVLSKLDKKVNNTNSYHLEGTLLINRGNDNYTYNVSSSFLKDDYYRVSLKNTINDHEQIIMRNDQGVFVLNPSLNKSFKFESNWPFNNSNSYLLQTIVLDIKNDPKYEIKNTKSGYTIKSKVNYANNPNLKYQLVYLDKDLNINKVEVYNSNDSIEIKMEIKNIDYKSKFDTDYFALESNEINTNDTKTTAKIEDAIYPMYLPTNTYLENQEKIKTPSGERVVLNFTGDNSFMLVEETVNIPSNLETYMVYGEPDIIMDTVGYVTDYSVSWISNGIEYYLVSNDMDTAQMVSVASSINVIPVGK